MPTRQFHYYIYDPSDIHPDSIVLEIHEYQERYREQSLPLIYICRNCENVARMLEEAIIYQEEAHRVKSMERLSDYFFQVQRTRLVSLEPITSPRKWQTFTKIVEAYNLGETGECSSLNDYLESKGSAMLEAVHGQKGMQNMDDLTLPGGEKFVADLINRYNQEALKK